MSSKSDFVRSAVQFLSWYFDVKEPKVVLNCEESCPDAGRCPYVGCYKPWSRTVSFKSGSEKGYIVSHEVGHHLDRMGIIEDGEPAAVAMEQWWGENVSELECTVCGYPLFASEDMVGQDVECPKCGSTFEVTPLRGRPEGLGGEVVVSKGKLAATLIGAPVLGVVVSGFVFDTLPKKGLSTEENIRRSRTSVGEILVASALGGMGYLLVK